ncbi:hypothetical protein Tco_1079875 [Tanacetum coccineum]|uniref:Uncharacterized protein n=1 Tax=Tanacetum coccineum TaxID=301880 RepID=A0ABQ5HT33_9ASTR
MQLSHIPIPLKLLRLVKLLGKSAIKNAFQIRAINNGEAPAMTKDALESLVVIVSPRHLEAQAIVCFMDNRQVLVGAVGLIDWWNGIAQPYGNREASNHGTELKDLFLTNRIVPGLDIKRWKKKLYNSIVKGNDLTLMV